MIWALSNVEYVITALLILFTFYNVTLFFNQNSWYIIILVKPFIDQLNKITEINLLMSALNYTLAVFIITKQTVVTK